MELASVAFYNQAAQKCAKNADAASKKIFEDLVADEEGHADTFDQQIQFIERFGERFLALQSIQSDAE
jgi:bacterioferritin